MSSHTGSGTGSATEPCDSSKAQAQISIGLVGLDRSGQFHAERLSLRAGIEIVAGCDPSKEEPRRLPGPRWAGRPVYSRSDELLARTDFDRVLIAGPIERRTEWAVQALEAGKHVALDAPPCSDATQLHDLLAVARRASRHLSILPTRRDGTEFRTAVEIVRGEHLGQLRSARLISWGKAVPYTPDNLASGKPNAAGEDDLFAIFAYQYVDQLLQLIRERPRSVFGRIAGNAQGDSTAPEFTLAIAFESGGDALIDVNLVSGAVLHTGWMLAGVRGGYSSGRIYLEEASGEISDAPMSESHLPEIDVYGEFLTWTGGKLGPAASARDAEIVMRVIDAARESSRTGQTVLLKS